jgi:GR25 family glycosyltransferase involved in LPS biosynthesis
MLYIIHYKKLKERKKYLKTQLDAFGVDYRFMESFDRDDIDNEMISSFYKKNRDLWAKRTSNIYTFNIKFRELKIGEICNALSHLEIFKEISIGDKEYGIILEDDIIFKNNFIDKLNNLINDTPNDFDIIFFGSSFNIPQLDKLTKSKSIKIKKSIYKKIPPTGRTVDGYIIKKELAKILYEKINEIVLPFDFELNYFLRKINPNCYWYDPGLIVQGSQNGKYKSSLR